MMEERSACHAEEETGEEKGTSGTWMPWGRGSRIGRVTDAADWGTSRGSAVRLRGRWTWERVVRRPRCGGREEERAEGVTPLTLEADTGEEVVREVERGMEEKEGKEKDTRDSASIVAKSATSRRSVGRPRREDQREDRREERWKGWRGWSVR